MKNITILLFVLLTYVTFFQNFDKAKLYTHFKILYANVVNTLKANQNSKYLFIKE